MVAWNDINIYSGTALFLFLCLCVMIILLLVYWNRSPHNTNGIPEDGSSADTFSGIALILGLTFLFLVALSLEQRRTASKQLTHLLNSATIMNVPKTKKAGWYSKVGGGENMPPSRILDI